MVNHSPQSSWLVQGGEMGALIRAKNWSKSALGLPENWPDSIKSAVSICLNSQSPIVLGVGSELRLIYNDASIPFLCRERHPAALGEPGRELWNEIWPAAEPWQKEAAPSSSMLVEDMPIFLHRTLPREEAYVTISCSPILATTRGKIEGWFCTCTETTDKVVGGRRSLTLRELMKRRKPGTVEAVCSAAAETLQKNTFDVPFAAIYELDAERGRVKRLATAGVAAGNAEAFPEYHVLGDPAPAEHWRLSRALHDQATVQVDDVYGSIGFLPSGPWQDSAKTALVFPLLSPRRAGPARALILGVSARCVLDRLYSVFLNGVAGQIEHSLADVRPGPAEQVQSGSGAGADRIEPTPEMESAGPTRHGRIVASRLRQAQRLEAIGQITAGVVHDFNNVLGIVVTNAHMLSRKLRDPETRQELDLICRAAERGSRLASQLLDFARKDGLEPESVDLNVKISEMCDVVSATLGGTMLITTELAEDVWPVFVDAMQLELAILNLAINGRDAMQTRGVLTIRTHNAVIESRSPRPEEPSPGEYAAIAVEDTGAGIPDDVLPFVFEPFFTTKEREKGTGLGLSQVFGFVKESKGGLRVRSKVGKGTCVTMLLPRAEKEFAESRVGAGIGKPHAPSGRRSMGTVLVVDDDREVLASTVSMVQVLGYTAVPAVSGEESLRMLELDRKIDVVLADFAMPDMNGLQLSEDIRAIRPAVSVILVTGYRDDEVLKQFDPARILQKPYSEDDLASKIFGVLT